MASAATDASSQERHRARWREHGTVTLALATGTAGLRSWTSNTPFAGMTQAGSTGMFSASTWRAPRWTRSTCETRCALSRSELSTGRWDYFGSWHSAVVFRVGAILSGYRGTCSVPVGHAGTRAHDPGTNRVGFLSPCPGSRNPPKAVQRACSAEP